MKIINHKSIDSAFWFALEEYIMHSPKFEDEYFLLWRTAPTLMIGRFQNTLQEINSDFVRENNIQIVRRNSGGGTIYTDPSAWQFSFITWKNKGEAKDFQVFTKPVIDALKKLGVPAEFNNRNDILAAGKKFSGNAQFSTKDRFLHHGSILYDTNLDFLVKALHVDDEKFISKGIKSVRERVTNIRPFMAKDLTSKGFSIAMRDLLASEMQEHKLDSSDMEEIERIRDEKFHSWNWNYGTSPEFNFKKYKRFEGGKVEVNLMVKNGIIKDCKISGDFFAFGDMNEFEKLFINCRHHQDDIQQILEKAYHENMIYKVNVEELLSLFF